MEFAFQIIILIFSVVIHEVSHGYIADYLGDNTARRAGRLTLNPFSHLSFLGSFVVPFFLSLAGGPVFGWAKPVPYNPNNLDNPKKAAGLIGGAGPASNFIIAIVFGVLYRILSGIPSFAAILPLFSFVISINVVLAVFNLLPLPPLDGSKILFSLMPNSWYKLERFLNQYGMFILLFIIFFGINFIIPVVVFFHRIFAGAPPVGF